MDETYFRKYADDLSNVLNEANWNCLSLLADAIRKVWQNDRQVFLCGNGGSAANASHFANDLLYGVAKQGRGIRAHALAANEAVVTCLANDVSYDDIYSHQIRVLAQEGDLLIVFSGSGNSKNVISAIATAKKIGMTTSAILGYTGGQCKNLVQIPVHFNIDDMQIAEDLQQIAGHMIMKYLSNDLVAGGSNEQ